MGKSYTEKNELYPDHQILFDRSKQAGHELSRLLISLSTGILAVYFFALTGRLDDLSQP